MLLLPWRVDRNASSIGRLLTACQVRPGLPLIAALASAVPGPESGGPAEGCETSLTSAPA